MTNFNQRRKGRFDGGFGSKEQSMHRAVCSNCGNSCEVPFKPVNGKPVYCKDCFDKMGGASNRDRDDRGPRREFKKFDRHEVFSKREGGFNRHESPSYPKTDSNEAVRREIQLLSTKLDKLISIAETFVKPQPKVTSEVSSAPIVTEESSKKVVAKKKVKSKKA